MTGDRDRKPGVWKPPTRIYVDMETCSVQDLKITGAYRYFEDKTTHIYLVCWAIGNGPVQVWFPGEQPTPMELVKATTDAVEFCGHNVVFEHVGLLRPMLRVAPDKLVCTMAKAAYHGLPLSLEDAAWALTGKDLKDKKGKALMLRWSRPRHLGKDGVPVWWHEEKDQVCKLDEIVDYCKRDVEAARILDRSLPDLPPREKEVWLMDLEINDGGMLLDDVLAERLEKLAKAKQENVVYALRKKWGASSKLGASSLSIGDSGKLRGWLVDNEGLTLPDVTKDTIAAALTRKDLSERCRDVLEARKAKALTSTAKFQRMLAAQCQDGRLRGMLQYYGALRTGRWAGRGPQPHNYPRPERDYATLIQAATQLRTADPVLSWEDVDMLWGDALELSKDMLRSCLVAPQSEALSVADYDQIEARILAWLSGQADILEQYRNGVDVYQYVADQIAGGSRTLGKVTVLACGFGMGVDKFVDTCAGYGISIDRKQAQELVWGWRNLNSRTVDLWKRLEDAVAYVVGAPRGGRFQVDWLSVDRWGPHLRIELPSGRHLYYRNMRLEPSGLVFDGVDSYTRKFGPIRTWGGKLVENATQAVARDIMVEGMLALREALFRICLTVHDEVIVESGELAKILALMNRKVAWAPGLPVSVSGWKGPRYGKQ